MADLAIPIAQILRNYQINLPAFPLVDEGPAAVHRFYLEFYRGFASAARAIAESEQPKALERIHKTLWAFARFGRVSEDGGLTLEISRAVIERELKMPRAEETFALLEALGAQLELLTGGAWAAGVKLKNAEGARLRFAADQAGKGMPLARAFPDLAARILDGQPKDKPAFERFLRADPRAVLARERPPLPLPPDAACILANLPERAAAAWQELTGYLASFDDYAPSVEFRAIHHGMWVANYDHRHSGIDLCGLVVQNGEMAVRVILYREMHERVGAMLDDFGDPVRGAFQRAHWYEDFQHQWLFIPVTRVEETAGVKKLLAMQVEALGRRKKENVKR